MPDPAQLLTLLRSFPFLADQPEWLLERLVQQAQLLRYTLGQPICRATDPPAHVHFLLQGTARSVVMASRLPRGVATLQRLQPGAVMGWTALSCGRNHEILIASTDLISLAVPQQALEEAMGALPQLAQRVRSSVNAAELFAVLDQHLLDHPRTLAHEVVEAALRLADGTRVVSGPLQAVATVELPRDRLWLSAGGILPAGATVPPLPQPLDDRALRLLGVDRDALTACLDPEPVVARSQSLPGWRDLLLERWEEQRLALAEEITPALDPGAADVEEPEEPSRMPPQAFPWHRGIGPLDSPISAFRMLSDHLGLPYRRELLRRVFGDQVKRHGWPPWRWRERWRNRSACTPSCCRSPSVRCHGWRCR